MGAACPDQDFEGSGRLVIDQGCGLSISGNHGSIMHYPFPLNCKAYYSYDEDQNRYVYDFFGEREIRPKENFYYNSIAMKNSGNDYYWGDLRDDVKVHHAPQYGRSENGGRDRAAGIQTEDRAGISER